MSEGRDEKLTASQLELGLREARGKEAEERERGSGVGGLDARGTSPCCRTLFLGGASSPVVGKEEGAGGGEGAQTWESIEL